VRRDLAADPRAADAEARLRAQSSFARPLVLEAGAGTGKTATLVARIVAWCLGPGWRRAAAEVAAQAARTLGGEAPAAERIAARVLDGVVAITFTEAAAAEMAGRVAQALADVRRGTLPKGLLPEALAGAEGEAEARAAALVVALDHLVVATIHAFCRRLLADAPLEAGLHPAFTVDAEGRAVEEAAREIVESAFRAALSGAGEQPLVELAVRGFGPAEVADALAELAAAGVPPAALAADPLAPAAVAALAGEVRAAAAAVAALVGPRVGGLKKNTLGIAVASACAGLERMELGTLAELAPAVTAALPANLVKRLEEWGRGDVKGGEAAALADVAGELREPAARLAALATHAGRLDPELLALAWRALAPLLAELERTLRARGAETFAALLRDARDLLAGRPAVRAAVRAGITQLLVDEFQDTDRLQCEIVRLLALDGPAGERPGLFLIGDPKQSIYGWRNADLAAYDGFLALVREHGGEVLSLAVNFRSLPAILGEVSRVVEPVMVRRDGVQPEFQPLLPSPERAAAPPPSGGRAPVEHWVSWAPPDDGSGPLAPARARDAGRIEALAAAAEIRELHGEGVAWGEIGVLLRTTGSLDVVVGALRDAGVPYAVERDRSYYRRREVIEAAALVRAILDPGDHLALVTVLRSGLVGVPDAALVPLWERGLPDHAGELAGPDGGRLGRLAALVEDAAAALPPGVPGLERVAGWEGNLTAFLALLARLRGSFASEPAAVFVERLRTATLFEAGEAARALGAYRTANLDRFFRTLLEEIEGGGEPQAILRGLRASVAEAREALEGRPLATGEDAVRVMTIHKAKGLDFGHVYLLQAHGRPRGGRRLGTDAGEVGGRFEYVLLGAPTAGWHEVEARRRRVEEAELVRTLYVAVTRAKDRLVVAGSWPGAAPPARPRSHVDLLARRAPAAGLPAIAARVAASAGRHADEDGARWVFPALAAAAASAAPAAPAPGLATAEQVAAAAARLAELRVGAEARMGMGFSAPASEEAHRLLRELLDEGGADPPEREGAARARVGDERDSPATAAGSALHGILERLDLAGDIGAQLAAARSSLGPLMEGMIGPERRGDAVRRAEEVLARLTAGPLPARLAAIAPHVLARELAVVLPPGGGAAGPVGFVAGAIDLLYRDRASGELVVADYKSDEVTGADEVAARAASYAPQGEVYRRAVALALRPARPPRFELWFLHAGIVVACG
jgi:ATP-dependent exoDNAse (exonuclease V) beta subunit